MPTQQTAPDSETQDVHPAFERLSRKLVSSLQLQIQEFRHRQTAARHFHFCADDDNNAFLVAFRTVPQDSTGVAHILEHTSLCGSDKYPVRDPFFMMLRRSLSTFMNAFTASDWTAYPFATQNRKDFYNLLSVYLDAVFFPRLDALDFAQEGHRIEVENPQDPRSPLVYKGVVYNEMKGAMSSPLSQISQTLQSELFPTLTYHYNSGGDPEDIPQLSYSQLKRFHAQHYHPSNAVLMTYGNLPAAEHQAYFDECALRHFSRQNLDFEVGVERRYGNPRTVTGAYSLDGEEDVSAKSHVVMAWLLGTGENLRELLLGHLLAGVLLDNSSSPLRYALETTALGASPSELCGLDDSTREMSFVCGLEGADAEHAEEIGSLILGVLERVAEDGLPREQIDAVLHQLELNQREIRSGTFPYGLRLMVNTLAPTLHGGDPGDLLDIDPVLEQLRKDVRDPEFIPQLVRRQLLDNPHRVRLTMVPDTGLSAQRQRVETERLEAARQALDETARSDLVELARRLEQRQNEEDDPELLPKVGLEDVPDDIEIPEGEALGSKRLEGRWFAAGTNGMVYQQVIAELPALDAEKLDLLPLLCEAVGEVGSGGRSYLQTQALQAALTGGIGARTTVRSAPDHLNRCRGFLILAGKALSRNMEPLGKLLHETWAQPRFDEHSKLRELVSESRLHREQSITQSGHALAMAAASARLSPLAALSHRWDGLEGLAKLKALDERLHADSHLVGYGNALEELWERLRSGTPQFLLVGESTIRDAACDKLDKEWAELGGKHPDTFALESSDGVVREIWTTSTQVNFCAKAYGTVPQGHEDAPALTVLGGFLRNGYLHRVVREQGGAYGGGASFDSDTGAFRFYSYRDPRLVETLADFDDAVDWLMQGKHPSRALEEAILGVIGAIDRPNSPAGEAIASFFAGLHGRTPEFRREFRRKILDVGLDDLRTVAERYLRPEKAHVAVISNPETAAQQDELEVRAC